MDLKDEMFKISYARKVGRPMVAGKTREANLKIKRIFGMLLGYLLTDF